MSEATEIEKNKKRLVLALWRVQARDCSKTVDNLFYYFLFTDISQAFLLRLPLLSSTNFSLVIYLSYHKIATKMRENFEVIVVSKL